MVKQSILTQRLISLVCCWMMLQMLAFADSPEEGMWTFDNPPMKQLLEKYNFKPSPEWLKHVRLASVRFNDGGSGSFVSPNGLVITNHHVGVGQIQKLSTSKKDLVQDGFWAKTKAGELKCPDLELNVLFSMENVTKQIRDAANQGKSEKEKLEKRKAVIAKIENESQKNTGLRSRVVKLYHGGEYWLYRYKKYTDVRLVFAPERQIAYFGGDFDNFTYPRYCLDIAFFRVYENGEPIKNEHYFKWNRNGAQADELVFVSGNPGSTNRLYTHAQFEYQRDHALPLVLEKIERLINAYEAYGQKSPEAERQALIQIFRYKNSQKAYTGMHQGLLNEELMQRKMLEENKFLEKINENAELKARYGGAWATLNKLFSENSDALIKQYIKRPTGSKLFSMAIKLVQYQQEIRKSDDKRLDGFHDSELENLKFHLFSPAPIYPKLEAAGFAAYLTWIQKRLGKKDPFVKAFLGGKSPESVAKRVMERTRLERVSFRKKMFRRKGRSIKRSRDPLIALARKVEPLLRENRGWYRNNVTSVQTTAEEKIANARFEIHGKNTYPDATFTLRLSYGTVKGYSMNGTKAPFKTTLYGLYDRSMGFEEKDDFKLPKRYWELKAKLDLATPVNFVTTNDIVGGNSGSPLINKDAEFVGIAFDGNIESLVGDYIYDINTNRSVAVHSAFIIEALRKLYDAEVLADEIEGSKK